MRNLLYFLTLGFLVIFICFIIFSLPFQNNNQKLTVISPISSLSFWLPSLRNKISANFSRPYVSAGSAFVYDTTENAVLYEKNPKVKLPMASLTKIMTAIVALEHPKKSDQYKVLAEDLVGEDSMGLEKDEVLFLKELLYGLMLHSGNDAAETLASNFVGGRTVFIKAMNDKAKSMGLRDTNFTNPTGLEEDGREYSTAYDLVVITRYALVTFPLFNEVVATFDYNIDANSTHKAYFLENETNLISSYPGVKGVKTGFTPEAGLCLVTYLDFNGHKIIAVILGSENRRGEMIDLLDYSLKSIGITPPHHG